MVATILFLFLILLALFWIGMKVGAIVRHIHMIAAKLHAADHTGDNDELVRAVGEINDRLDDLTTIAAYWVAETDSPISGLYGEPDYTLEKDRNDVEMGTLIRARSALRRLAKS